MDLKPSSGSPMIHYKGNVNDVMNKFYKDYEKAKMDENPNLKKEDILNDFLTNKLEPVSRFILNSASKSVADEINNSVNLEQDANRRAVKSLGRPLKYGTINSSTGETNEKYKGQSIVAPYTDQQIDQQTNLPQGQQGQTH